MVSYYGSLTRTRTQKDPDADTTVGLDGREVRHLARFRV